MKIAIIGSGGREHALVCQLKKSPRCTSMVAIPGNGGIAQDCPCVPIKPTDITSVVEHCASNHVDYVVVAPDDPLALGMVDALAEKGIPAFGPSKAAARIEASKVFSKQLMRKYGIPTADYQSFSDMDEALAHVRQLDRFPIIVKADGLALGKGVLICQTLEETQLAVKSMMEEQAFGAAGRSVVVEEFLQGPELSVLAFSDGKTVVPMVSSMDHKRALDGDAGKNTGGMGAVAPNPYYTDKIAETCMETIFLPTMKAMLAEGAPFSGCLYFGLILTGDGPKVIEYNARFGDPEAQAVLPLLQSDMLEIMLACTNGTLSADMVRFSTGASACVVLASGGYPDAYQIGYPVTGIGAAENDGVTIYHAGTAVQNGEIVTSGGRVLAVSAQASCLGDALKKAYCGVEKIHFTNVQYRRDIGAKAMEQAVK